MVLDILNKKLVFRFAVCDKELPAELAIATVVLVISAMSLVDINSTELLSLLLIAFSVCENNRVYKATNVEICTTFLFKKCSIFLRTKTMHAQFCFLKKS